MKQFSQEPARSPERVYLADFALFTHAREMPDLKKLNSHGLIHIRHREEGLCVEEDISVTKEMVC